MKRRVLLLCAVLLSSFVALGAPPDAVTADQAKRDLKILKRAFSDLHPGLYRYLTPEQFEAEFAKANAAVENGSSIGSMYLLGSQLAAAVRCGHTWTNPLNQPDRVRAVVFDGADKLPLHVRLLHDDRLLVTASSDAAVSSNEELLAIDDRSTSTLVAELLPFLRADGSNDGKRRAQIDSDINGGAMDRLLPLLHPPVSGQYRLRLRGPQGRVHEVAVSAVTANGREDAMKAAGFVPASDDWQFEIRKGIGLLTLPTFSFWRSGFDWQGFLDRSFTTLETNGVKRLVIDLRSNEGGDDKIGDALLSHLLHKPYTVPASTPEVSFERVPYVLARYLDTWDFSFFDHTGHVEKTAGRNFRLLDEQPPDRVIVPVEKPFGGRVFVLTGPQMSSAGYLIARDLKASGAARLIGRPTGGNLRGLNGGQLAWITLPNSGVTIDIPLIAWMPASPQPDSGVQPDVLVDPTLEDVARGIDPEMAAALALLRKS